MLIGNHDWSYISGTRDGCRVSGHQSGHILEIRNLLEQNLDIIDLAFECDGWVFSPSGDEISQGHLWIRPESLLQDAYYPKQVVGHTEMCLYEKVFKDYLEK